MSKRRLCLVALDVRSAHNIGSLFRSCDGFDCELVLVGAIPRPSHEYDDRLPHIVRKAEKEIAKTALGAERTVRWRYVSEWHECVALLKDEGYHIVALETDIARAKPLPGLSSNMPLAFVVGREVEGLSSGELRLCDEVRFIPMNGTKESFNVSVAAAVALYHARFMVYCS